MHPHKFSAFQRRLQCSLAAILAASTVFVLSPGDARAQATDGEFSVQRFDPAPGPRNYFTTRGVRTDGEMAWSAGLHHWGCPAYH